MSKRIATLALDLAGTTGVAMRFRDEKIWCGQWKLTRGNLGGRRSPIPAVRLYKRLRSLGKLVKIDRVIYEETFARGEAKFRLDSLQVTVCIWAVLNGISWMRLSPSTIKKSATGNGRASKEDMIAAARKLWPDLDVRTSDIADALHILNYVKC